jgi:predicted dehydrogenase
VEGNQVVTRKIGVGIVGAGAIAAAHSAAVREHGGGELAAVFDVQPERAREARDRWGFAKVASSLEELIGDGAVEAVIVCTPPASHAATTIAALEAGKHVLCEKPLALEVDDATAMVRAAERSSAFLACASARLRCSPAQQAARRMIDGGELGDVYHVRCSLLRLRLRPGHHYAPLSRWFLDRSLAGGGVIIDLGVYAIDVVLWMLGNPAIVSVTAQTRRLIEVPVPGDLVHDVEDHAVIMLQCENGKSAVIETAWVSNMTPPESVVVLGTRAGLRLDPLTKITAREVGAYEYDPMLEYQKAMFGGDVVYFRAAEEQLFPYPEFSAANPSQVTMQFLDGVASGVQPQTSGQEALQITRIVDAAYRSSQSRGSLPLRGMDVDPLPSRVG